MKITHKLTKAEYYDSEKECFIVIADNTIPTELAIMEEDGVTWNCYLYKVRYAHAFDNYICEYKKY